jgi:histidine triad (HIT) family protein
MAFLDVNPLVKGHTLVIPKREQDYLFDLEDDSFVGLHLFAKEVAIQLKKHIACKRIGVAVIGLEVPHAHIHLIPLNEMEDINFNRKKLSFSPEELTTIADELKMF